MSMRGHHSNRMMGIVESNSILPPWWIFKTRIQKHNLIRMTEKGRRWSKTSTTCVRESTKNQHHIVACEASPKWWKKTSFELCLVSKRKKIRMSKLSFRARQLDANKPLPIYRVEELPDLSEISTINRAVPQMPTGMEKEEETVSYYFVNKADLGSKS